MKPETEDLIRRVGAPYSLYDPRWFMIGVSEHGARGFWLRMAASAATSVMVVTGFAWLLLPSA